MRPPDSAVRERARREDRDDTVPLMRATVDNVVRGGSCWSAALMRPLFWWRRCWTAGADEDVTEVEAAIERVAAVSTDPRRVRNEI